MLTQHLQQQKLHDHRRAHSFRVLRQQRADSNRRLVLVSDVEAHLAQRRPNVERYVSASSQSLYWVKATSAEEGEKGGSMTEGRHPKVEQKTSFR